ncbi:MAG: hypothetical protein BGP03_20555 [Pseudonocardia sp. 73-21]|nr:MAG: hypothetical protein BGP03_20555 [Pseudonocardia sp. 73-21]
MRAIVRAGIAFMLLGGVVLIITPQRGDDLRDAVTAVGCHGVLVTLPTASTGALDVSASDCADVPADSGRVLLDEDLVAMSKAVWAGRTTFSTLNLTIYRVPDEDRPPRSVVLSATQLESWFGPRTADIDPVGDRTGEVAEGLLWVLVPVAGLAACVLLAGAVRSGRMVVMWIVR